MTADSIEPHETEPKYPPKKVLLPIVLSVCLASFLSSLVRTTSSYISRTVLAKFSVQDRTIIGVAVPAISNEFGSFSDISWYESAYLLTFSTLQLPMGKVYVCSHQRVTYPRMNPIDMDQITRPTFGLNGSSSSLSPSSKSDRSFALRHQLAPPLSLAEPSRALAVPDSLPADRFSSWISSHSRRDPNTKVSLPPHSESQPSPVLYSVVCSLPRRHGAGASGSICRWGGSRWRCYCSCFLQKKLLERDQMNLWERRYASLILSE